MPSNQGRRDTPLDEAWVCQHAVVEQLACPAIKRVAMLDKMSIYECWKCGVRIEVPKEMPK